jgi:hypothetical protein
MKLNLKKYVSKDKVHPERCGVYHGGGFRVASDGYILIALSGQGYAEEFEGKSVDFSGQVIDGIYPRWERCVPNESQMTMSYVLSYPDIFEAVKLHKEKRRENKNQITVCKINDVIFDCELLLKLAQFGLYKGFMMLKLSLPYRAAAIYCPDGSVGLIMPMMFNYDDNEDDENVTVVNLTK